MCHKILFGNDCHAQDLLYIKDSLTINSEAELYVKGGIKYSDNAALKNNGTIYIKTNTVYGGESWTNNASPNLMNGQGKVVFMSFEEQMIKGHYKSEFFDLDFDNRSASGIVLKNSITILNRLFLSDGIITTDSNKVIILNPNPNSISGYQQATTTPSFINGNLRRYISNSSGRYGFPVGKGDTFYLQEIKINALGGNLNYLDSKFDILINHFDNDLVATENGKPYSSVCDEGVWYLSPDQQPLNISYDCWSYIGNFTNCNLLDNHFAILKRPRNSLMASEWDCEKCGTSSGLNPDDGDGRLVIDGYALRKNLSSFSQFGIGKMVCETDINLGKDVSLQTKVDFLS